MYSVNVVDTHIYAYIHVSSGEMFFILKRVHGSFFVILCLLKLFGY